MARPPKLWGLRPRPLASPMLPAFNQSVYACGQAMHFALRAAWCQINTNLMRLAES